jgi:hypothetical protein
MFSTGSFSSDKSFRSRSFIRAYSFAGMADRNRGALVPISVQNVTD